MIKCNGIEIKPTIFPDRTSQVWQTGLDFTENSFTIDWVFENEAELFQLVQLVYLIRNVPLPLHLGEPKLVLNIPYLPYGRQDKEVTDSTTFALFPFGEIINSLNFQEVRTIDAHSEASKYINNLRDEFPKDNIHVAMELKENSRTFNVDAMCYPDKGAEKRYRHSLDYRTLELIVGDKTRDQQTGYITDYKLDGDPKGKKVLIVDDICDGGMTFILLTKELIAKGAKEVNLYVTHGIFSKGIEVLKEAGINRVFTRKGEVKCD